MLGFAVEADGKLLMQPGHFQNVGEQQVTTVRAGVKRTSERFRHDQSGIEVLRLVETYEGLDVVRTWLEVSNASAASQTITRIDTVNGLLPVDHYALHYFRSNWGMEFSPTIGPLEGTKILEVTTGRSTKGLMPWFFLQGESGRAFLGTVAWSGNWIIRFEPDAAGAYRVSAGLSNWQFAKVLKPGETMRAPDFLYVERATGDMVDCSVQLARWGRSYGYPHNELSRRMPVEWNHWWPLEDQLINERVFAQNSDVAREMGYEVAMLDAGWFGPSDERSEWYRHRGDWHLVNARRFPAGLASLATHVQRNKQAFGIWCEIEALGDQAETAKQHPEFAAQRDGRSLGYVCFGNPAVRQWAFATVERLIKEHGAQWIKFDFNLDPGAGCNRTDHGHGPGDGLYEHYLGYYALLDRIREKYPNVFLENCSSGGLRIDLGIMQHLHATFLSDPDYTEHALQLTWGAAMMLHPSAMLRFAWSQTNPASTHNRETDPLTSAAPQSKIDFIARTAMMGIFGMSFRLPELPPQHRERLKYHILFYKQHVRELLRDGDFMPLTTQPNRDGTGERWPAFLCMDPRQERGIAFVFRMRKGDASRTIKLRHLRPELRYEVRFEDKEVSVSRTGQQLMDEGLTFEGIAEEASEVLLLSATK